MQKRRVSGAVFTALLGLLCLPEEAVALPGFSRQMNMECTACHYQTMRQLNSFGRIFASSGFTMTGGPQASSMIEGTGVALGLPAALNASVLLKARYEKSYDKQNPKNTSLEDVGTDRGSVQLYKAWRVFLGGRIAENVGGLLNFNNESWGAKVAVAFEAGTGYAGGVLFRQEDSGPFSGMEYYNTGLYKPLRLFESRKSGNAAQATGVGNGPASGGQLYYGGESLYATVGAYIPAAGGSDGLDVGTDFIPFGRLAYELIFDFGSLMVGGYIINGEARLTDATLDGDDTTDPKPSTATFAAPHDVMMAGAKALAAGFLRVSIGDDVPLQQATPEIQVGRAFLRPQPGGFLQASPEAEAFMASLVRQHLKYALEVADLFSGCGTFALRLAEESRVHAAEGDAEAIEALEASARAASGLKPVTAEVRDLFRNPVPSATLSRFQGIVLNPPRAGAAKQVAEIAYSGVRRIAYVSCDPGTLARDLRVLVDAGYRIMLVQPVDQFLWSTHVETVVLLERGTGA